MTTATTHYCPPCDLFRTYTPAGTLCPNCHGAMVPVGTDRPLILDPAARQIGAAVRGDRRPGAGTLELIPATCRVCNYPADPELTDTRDSLDLEEWLYYCATECRAIQEYADNASADF